MPVAHPKPTATKPVGVGLSFARHWALLWRQQGSENTMRDLERQYKSLPRADQQQWEEMVREPAPEVTAGIEEGEAAGIEEGEEEVVAKGQVTQGVPQVGQATGCFFVLQAH